MNKPKAMENDVINKETHSSFIITKETISNMDIERILVSAFITVEILKITRLSKLAQEEVVDKLVDRTPNWMELDDAVRVEKIKTVLTQETVIEYLKSIELIRKEVDMVEVGVDEEGSIIVSAFYTKLNRETRRLMKQQFSKEDLVRMEQAVNILDGQENLVDLAAARIKKLKRK